MQREDEWINSQNNENASSLQSSNDIAQNRQNSNFIRHVIDNSRFNAGRLIFLRRGVNFPSDRIINPRNSNQRLQNGNQANEMTNNNIRSLRNSLGLRVTLFNIRESIKIIMIFLYKIMNQIAEWYWD